MTPSIRLEAVLWPGTARLDLRLEIEKHETLAKECAYVAFPIAVPDGSFVLDIPGAALRAGQRPAPGSCTDWHAARRWVDVGSQRFGVLWAGRDVPVVSLGAINTGRIAERFEQRGTGIFAYALNNAWDTNFKESQGGRLAVPVLPRAARGAARSAGGARIRRCRLLADAVRGDAVRFPCSQASPGPRGRRSRWMARG